MTCKEKYMQEHPDESISEVIKKFCPCEFYDIDDPEDCTGGVTLNDPEECKRCWNREIPETENKKENEEMKVCVSICEEKTRLIEELKNTRERLAEVSECYAESLKERDELKTKMKRLNETNEDLADKLAAERAKVERLEGMVATRDEEIDKLVKENDYLMNAMAEKNEEIMNLRAEKDAMAAGKAKALAEAKEKYDSIVKKFESEMFVLNSDYAELNIDYVKLKNSIEKMGFEVRADNEVITYLHRPHIMTEAEYFKQDIEATKKLAEKFNSCGNECALHPTDIARTIARHMRNKYDALIYVGFSHDDAMSLIPMWTD